MVGSGDAFYHQPENYDELYFDDAELIRGRVEICIGGRFGTICEKLWTNQDASVACKQLGYSTYGQFTTYTFFC